MGLRSFILVPLLATCFVAVATAGAVAQDAAPQAEPQTAPGKGGMIEVDQSGTDEQAKAYFRVGRSLYDSGRFAEAAAEWQKSYELSQRHELLYNIYVAYRDANDRTAATEALRGYLAHADVAPSRRVNLEARLRALEQGATVEEVEETEPPGEPAEPAAPEPALQMSTDENVASEILPYALIGVGGAMVVAGAITGVMTNSKVSDVEDSCTGGADGTTCPAGFGLDGKTDDIETLALVTDVLLIGGAAVLGTGVVLMLLDDSGEAAPAASAAPTASLGCGPTGCMAQVRGRF